MKGWCKQLAAIMAHLQNGPYTWFLPLLLPLDWLFPELDTVLSESEKNGRFSTLYPKYVRLQSHVCQKATKAKYNLCKQQFRGNLKIKNSWISSKGLVGIEIKLSQKNLLSFLDYKPLPELLKNFSSIWSTGKISV